MKLECRLIDLDDMFRLNLPTIAQLDMFNEYSPC